MSNILFNATHYEGTSVVFFETYENKPSIILFKNTLTNKYEIITSRLTENNMLDIYLNLINTKQYKLTTLIDIFKKIKPIALQPIITALSNQFEPTNPLHIIHKILAKNITKCKSFHERRQHIIEVLDTFFDNVEKTQITNIPAVKPLIAKISNMQQFVGIMENDHDMNELINKYLQEMTDVDKDTLNDIYSDFSTYLFNLCDITCLKNSLIDLLNQYTSDDILILKTVHQLKTATTKYDMFKLINNLEINSYNIDNYFELMNITVSELLQDYHENISAHIHTYNATVSTTNEFTVMISEYMRVYDFKNDGFPLINQMIDTVSVETNATILLNNALFAGNHVNCNERTLVKTKVYHFLLDFKQHNYENIFEDNKNRLSESNSPFLVDVKHVYLSEFIGNTYRMNEFDLSLEATNGTNIPIDDYSKDIIYYLIKKKAIPVAGIVGKLEASVYEETATRTFVF